MLAWMLDPSPVVFESAVSRCTVPHLLPHCGSAPTSWPVRPLLLPWGWLLLLLPLLLLPVQPLAAAAAAAAGAAAAAAAAAGAAAAAAAAT
jgi:hypothetical protein